MKKLVLGCVIGLAVTGALMGPASATIVYSGVTTATGLNTGTGQGGGATSFDASGASAETSAINSVAGYNQAGSNLTFFGNGASINQVLNGSSGIGAEPFNDNTNYLSVLANGSVHATISGPANQLTFYWGSIDQYNTITLFEGLTQFSFTGSAITPKFPTGCQQSADCNGLVTFQDTTGSITGFTITSSQNSFEADNFNATEQTFAGGVPETSTWAMMILGFLGVGLLSYRRKGTSFRFA